MTEIAWAHQSAYPILALLQLLPLAGAAAVYLLGETNRALVVGRLVAFLELGLAIDLYRHLDRGSAVLQLAERLDIAGPFAYHAAADGVTVLFVLLAALLSLLLSLYSMVRALGDPARLLAVMLAIEGVLVSMLVSVDLFWFVLASGFEIGLVGYLLWRWAASPEKDAALTRFLQFQGTGFLLLLGGTLLLGWNHANATGAWSFDLLALSDTPVAAAIGSLTFFMLFYGLAVRTPLFPLHGWLPVVAQHGNVAVAPTFLLGVKVGLYGLIRFVFPLLPEVVAEWSQFVAAFAAAGIFYAAVLAFLQTNLRRLMAFAVVSHTSLIVVGLFSLHPLAFQGGMLLAVNFGLAATAMLFMIGFVYRRTRTTNLARLGGLFDRIPFIGVAFLVGGLAIVGMPGTPGFDAAHLVLEAGIERFGALPTVAAALGNVAAAGFLLYAFQRAFLAPRGAGLAALEVERTLPMEYVVAGSVLAVLLVAGFYMAPWLSLVEVPLNALGARFGH